MDNNGDMNLSPSESEHNLKHSEQCPDKHVQPQAQESTTS